MKIKKELLASLTGAALFGTVANAEIPLTDDLSAYGYIDAYYDRYRYMERTLKVDLLSSSLGSALLLLKANGLQSLSFHFAMAERQK
jgi:hypothetical protein